MGVYEAVTVAAGYRRMSLASSIVGIGVTQITWKHDVKCFVATLTLGASGLWGYLVNSYSANKEKTRKNKSNECSDAEILTNRTQ